MAAYTCYFSDWGTSARTLSASTKASHTAKPTSRDISQLAPDPSLQKSRVKLAFTALPFKCSYSQRISEQRWIFTGVSTISHSSDSGKFKIDKVSKLQTG